MEQQGFISALRELLDEYENGEGVMSQEYVIESARELKNDLLPDNNVLKTYLDDAFNEYDKSKDEVAMMSELITTVQ